MVVTTVRLRRRKLVKPMAAAVPMMVEITAARMETASVTHRASRIMEFWNNSLYQSRVKPDHTDRLLDALKENTMSTKMGSVEEQKDQQHKEAAADAPGLFHRNDTPSSPSPKRFIMAMQTRTMTIITRAMAEPSHGL